MGEERSASHFPWLLKGYVLTHAAWNARSPGWSKEVPSDKAHEFAVLLNEARESLMHAADLNKKDPEPPSVLITVAQGLGSGQDAMQECYTAALARCPMSFGARVRKFEYLTPKWCGSWESMDAFADACAKDSEKWPLAGLIKAYACAERHFRTKFYHPLKNKKTWNELKVLFQKVFEQYPDLIEPRLECAYLGQVAVDYATARAQFDAVGDRWTGNYYWSDLPTYHRFRAMTMASCAKSLPKAEALKLAEEAVNMAPEEPYPHYSFGRALHDAGRQDEAYREYVIAATGAPLFGEIHARLA